jgi:hypothetical protein
MSNIRITTSASFNNARSESAVLINPNNPQQIVASSKKFKDIHNYDFSLATSYSSDGGQSWNESAALSFPSSTTVMTDPTLAWDDEGNVFLVGLVGTNPPVFNTLGMAIYKSTDGGQTWGSPTLIHTSANDDKQWAAGDANPASPHHGNVYAVWDDSSAMRFARTLDHGASWIGAGTNTIAATNLASDSFSPEINVAANGDIYIVWIAGSTIKLLVSTDGGDTFQSKAPPATAVTTLSGSLPTAGGWPVFGPDGKFRVLTVPTACVFGQSVVVAWDDFREGKSRIYYALSTDGGTSWPATGVSGRPLLSGPIPGGFHHFFPQIITNPNGVIGCAFYEFGRKPATPLIDVIMAQSLDGGASFLPFVVTDQPWDPTVDEPWAHHANNTSVVDPSVTFIGDYFGIDASYLGFYPVWTDTRTGIQELWTAIVPVKECAIIVERSTLGQDEIDARRGQPGGPVVTDAFRVVVDGFTAAQLALSGPGQILNVPPPTGGMTIICTGNTSATGGYGPEVQRFTFHYNIDFGPTDTAFGFAGPTEFLMLSASISGLSASAQIELIKQPNPFILHGDPGWLSVDLRVFSVRAGETRFGVTMGSDASAAPAFIQQVMAALTAGQGAAGGETFNGNLPVEEAANLYVYPSAGPFGLGGRVFNFGVAKVHYIGLIGAPNVRVFFRLFQAQSTDTSFQPSTTYRRAPSNPSGHPIPLTGILGNEYVTLPFFATPRVNTTMVGMDQQTDPPNIQTIAASPTGAEVDHFFGCWLDFNQPFKVNGDPNNILPVHVPAANVDGPFTDPLNPPLTIQQAILRNPHQCFVAEIAFDPVVIPTGKTPYNWDKLAQRNLAWSDIPNPGVDGSRRALDTFEVRPTPAGLPGRTPDELMIDWKDLPAGTRATIYLPGVNVDEVLSMASGMYATHQLVRVDGHTLQCPTGGITYIPVPPGTGINYAGLLSIDLPEGVQRGQVFNVVVRQVTNAFGQAYVPPPAIEITAVAATTGRSWIKWRRVLGAFQLRIPVGTKAILLNREERLLSVLRWIAQTIPSDNRWYPVFGRYLEQVGDRVSGFGGDPDRIPPSPTGAGHVAACDYKVKWLLPLLLAPLLVLIALAPLIWSAPLTALGIVLILATTCYWTWRCKPSICDFVCATILGISTAYLVLGTIVLLGHRSLGALLMLGVLGVLNGLLITIAMFRECCWKCGNAAKQE